MTSPPTSQYRIAAIGGDGIGPEVVTATIEVLDRLAAVTGSFSLAWTALDWNSQRYLKQGRYLPDDALDTLRAHDAILFGAVGSREVPDHVSLWGLRLAICQGLDQYANVRPTRVLPGIESPLRNAEGLDWVIVRENSEGEYSGQGGRSHRGSPHEVATEVSVFTRAGVERIHRFAFALARSRPDKHLTLVTKSNAQRFGMVLWDEVFFAVARDYPDVAVDRELVDAMTMRMVNRPRKPRHHRRHQPPRRHPLRPCRGTRRQRRHRADRQSQSRARQPLHVRADPRLRLRSGRHRPGQSHRHLLVGRDDAGAPGRSRRRPPPDGGHRGGHRLWPAHARSRRHARPRRRLPRPYAGRSK